MITWDFPRIWDYCGGAQGVVLVCKAASADGISIPPSPGTAAVWKYRETIPAEWLPTVIRHCLEGGMTAANLFVEPLEDDDLTDI